MTMSTNILFSSPPNYGPPVINTEYAYKCFPVRKFKQGNDDGKSKRMFMRLLASFDVRLAALRKTSLFEFDRALSFSSFD